MNNNNKTIENIFSQVRNDVAVPSYATFYSQMQSVTKPNEVRNTLRGWKLIPSMKLLVGATLVAVLMVPVIYSPKASDPVFATISEEGNREIVSIENEDAFITYTIDQYLHQLEAING